MSFVNFKESLFSVIKQELLYRIVYTLNKSATKTINTSHRLLLSEIDKLNLNENYSIISVGVNFSSFNYKNENLEFISENNYSYKGVKIHNFTLL